MLREKRHEEGMKESGNSYHDDQLVRYPCIGGYIH